MTYDEFLADPEFANTNGAIYKFRNKINGKCYIGKTLASVRKRVIEHMTTSRPWTKARKGYFQRALYKYGFENFEFSIIERGITDNDLLNKREIYWIGYYKSDHKEFGYNMTPGGDGNTNKEFNKLCAERLRKANLGSKRSQESKQLMSAIQKQRHKDPKRKQEFLEIAQKAWKQNEKRVVKLDLNYNLICTYDSLIKASEDIYNKKHHALSRNLQYKNNKTNGFRKGNYIYMLEEDYAKRMQK